MAQLLLLELIPWIAFIPLDASLDPSLSLSVTHLLVLLLELTSRSLAST
jgi:hypothetical protein